MKPKPNECQSHTTGIHKGKSFYQKSNTKARPHPCTTKQFRIDQIWICLNARQPQKFTLKHESKEDTGRNVDHRMLPPGWLRERGLKSFKAQRSERKALSPSIRNSAGYGGEQLRHYWHLDSLTIEEVTYEMLTNINYLTEIIKSSPSSLGQILVFVYMLVNVLQV